MVSFVRGREAVKFGITFWDVTKRIFAWKYQLYLRPGIMEGLMAALLVLVRTASQQFW